MLRLQPVALVSCLALAALPQMAFAADYPDTLRQSYQCCDATEYEDSLGFEVGLRYVYSRGSHRMSLATGDDYAVDDTSHILEGHLRVDDHVTDTFLAGRLGYSIAVNTEYETPENGNVTLTANRGRVAYVDADLGYVPFDGFGGYVGYSYMNESPYMDRVSFATATGGDSAENDLNIHALKLGLAASGQFGAFSIRGTAGIIPYAWLNGTYGAFYMAPTATVQQGSAGTIDGALYGATGEIELGYAATDNLSFNLGARAAYLTGDATMTFTGREIATPANEQQYITRTTSLSFLRYGVFGGISARF